MDDGATLSSLTPGIPSPTPGIPNRSTVVREMPSDIQNMILAACHKLNVRGVGELLTLGTVNKAFRRSVDQLVLAILNGEAKFDASSLRWETNANPQERNISLEAGARWIAMGCVSFVREAKMRGEPQSKVYVRSFMYTLAYQLGRDSPRTTIASALQRTSHWHSKDDAKRVAARDAFLRIATSRLAPGGQSLLPEISEEEIRKTLNLAFVECKMRNGS
jgi:hypothetical protein